MTTRTTRTAAVTRAGAAFAAITMTTLILGSQLGLAGHYTTEADAVLAAKRAAPVAHNTAGSATRQPAART
jgi:hypothetical protein